MLLSLVCGLLASPVQVQLQSQLPSEPIEDPAAWAWGLHPDNGLDYSAKVIIYQRAIKTRIIPALISPVTEWVHGGAVSTEARAHCHSKVQAATGCLPGQP